MDFGQSKDVLKLVNSLSENNSTGLKKMICNSVRELNLNSGLITEEKIFLTEFDSIIGFEDKDSINDGNIDCRPAKIRVSLNVEFVHPFEND